ncbi:YetF domain-containing protein [Paraliobacillus sp. X-1268]|uniref:YetF domain-containing protein n=1 Tax=Paraliobacillus sp. X-1268 TaxID=2213193 RepID=UPI000E3C2BF4
MYPSLVAIWTKAKPIYLYSQGEFNQEALRQERLKFEDVSSAVRKQGLVSFQQLDALILEGDGTITAVMKGDGSVPESVSDVLWTKKTERTLK